MPVSLCDISKKYGDNAVLDRVNLDIGDGEFVSLIGPSGVGKTTVLKILAGLEQADTGKVLYSQRPCRERPVIMVFQDFALFPHMNVAENVGYGLKTRGVPKKERREKVCRMLDWFGIGTKAGEFPAHLSAGQKQRAAIARAIIVEPMVLLLDEPFANLDRNLKGETAEFIRQTQKAFGITTVMVTHDQTEAFAVSDRVAVLIGGTLRQYETAGRIQSAPADSEVAKFILAGTSGGG